MSTINVTNAPAALFVSKMLEKFQEKLRQERNHYQGTYQHNIDTLLHALDVLLHETLQYGSPDVLQAAVENGNFAAFSATGLSVLDRVEAVLTVLAWQSLHDELDLITIDFSAWVAQHRVQLNHLQLIEVLRALIGLSKKHHSRSEFKRLSCALLVILAAYDQEVKNTDCAFDDPDTIWHTLFLNCVSFALSSYDIALMEQVFPLFIGACPPHEVAAFFLGILDDEDFYHFPDDIKALFQKYRPRGGNLMTSH